MPTTVTKTVKSSGGDYSSLSGWEAGEQADLPTADEIRQAECYAMSDTTGVTVNGWTTDATRYIRIYVPTAEQHDRTLTGTSGYILLLDFFASGLLINEDNVRVEGVKIRTNPGGNSGYAIRVLDAGTKDIRINTCLFANLGNTYIDVNNGGGTIRAWNNFLIGVSAGSLVKTRSSWTGTIYFYNNTVVTNDQGDFYATISRETGTFVAKNTIALVGDNSSVLANAWSGTFDAASTNNASDDETAPNTNEQTGTPSFVDITDDVHLVASDTVAKNNGTDLSGDSNLAFSDDIDGTARPQGSAWDIGAHELVLFQLLSLSDSVHILDPNCVEEVLF